MSSFQNYTTLSIQGVCLDKKALFSWAEEQVSSLEEWRKELGIFLLEWLNVDNFVIVHTSGSTGTPKPIRISKQQMIHSALATGEYFNLEKKQRALLCLPCRYIAGKMMVVRALVLGLDLWINKPSSPLLNIDKSIDFAAMTPMQVNKILAQKQDISRLKQLIIGGAPVSSALALQLQELSTACFSTFGMTETVTHIAIQNLNGASASDIFHTLPHVSIRQDTRGCLVIDAPLVADSSVITNDIVEIIGHSSFQWLGRFDSIINTGGVKVFPEIVEKKLSAFIQQPFFIHYTADEQLGQKVILLIEGNKQQNSTDIPLRIKQSDILTPYEKPKLIFYVPAFARTKTGKILRQKTSSTLVHLK